jgi:hypothetical protein
MILMQWQAKWLMGFCVPQLYNAVCAHAGQYILCGRKCDGKEGVVVLEAMEYFA